MKKIVMLLVKYGPILLMIYRKFKRK